MSVKTFNKLSEKKLTYLFMGLLVVFVTIMRLVPHIVNIAPVAGLALFAGAYFNRRYAIFLPIAVMFVSDLFIGFYSWKIMLSVYGSFALIGVMGSMLKENKTFFRVFGTTLAGSIVFFVVSNWAVWAFSSLYEPTLAGLMQSYVMGLPFLKGTIVGDFMYVGIFFGAYELALRSLKQKHSLNTALRVNLSD